VSHPQKPVDFRLSSLQVADRDARRTTLENRLEDGYHRIDQAVLTGADVTEWESFWLRLLGEYEEVCRELEQAA
jgi:hypothetical protein